MYLGVKGGQTYGRTVVETVPCRSAEELHQVLHLKSFVGSATLSGFRGRLRLTSAHLVKIIHVGLCHVARLVASVEDLVLVVVVPCSLLFVAQDLVRLLDSTESQRGPFNIVWVLVGVVGECQFAEPLGQKSSRGQRGVRVGMSSREVATEVTYAFLISMAVALRSIPSTALTGR